MDNVNGATVVTTKWQSIQLVPKATQMETKPSFGETNNNFNYGSEKNTGSTIKIALLGIGLLLAAYGGSAGLKQIKPGKNSILKNFQKAGENLFDGTNKFFAKVGNKIKDGWNDLFSKGTKKASKSKKAKSASKTKKNSKAKKS